MAKYLEQTVGKLDHRKQKSLYADYLAASLLSQCLALRLAESANCSASDVAALIHHHAAPMRDDPVFAEAENIALQMLAQCGLK